VKGVDSIIFRELTQLQHDIRDKGLELYIVGLDKETRKYLLEKAVVRMKDLRKTFEEAVASIKAA